MSDKKEVLSHLTDNQLMDVYYNYGKYNYPESFSQDARDILLSRGVPEDEFEATEAALVSAKFRAGSRNDQARSLLRDYQKWNRFAIILYLVQIMMIPLIFFILGQPVIYFILAIPLAVLFLVVHIFSINKYLMIDEMLNKQEDNAVIRFVSLYILSVPFSPIFGLFQIRKLKKRLEED